MFDFDMFPDMGEGLFPSSERKDCPFCGENENNENGVTDNGGMTERPSDKRMVLAMGYVPAQAFDDLYGDYSKALDSGSLFSSLVKPFYGGKGER